MGLLLLQRRQARVGGTAAAQGLSGGSGTKDNATTVPVQETGDSLRSSQGEPETTSSGEKDSEGARGS